MPNAAQHLRLFARRVAAVLHVHKALDFFRLVWVATGPAQVAWCGVLCVAGAVCIGGILSFDMTPPNTHYDLGFIAALASRVCFVLTIGQAAFFLLVLHQTGEDIATQRAQKDLEALFTSIVEAAWWMSTDPVPEHVSTFHPPKATFMFDGHHKEVSFSGDSWFPSFNALLTGPTTVPLPFGSPVPVPSWINDAFQSVLVRHSLHNTYVFWRTFCFCIPLPLEEPRSAHRTMGAQARLSAVLPPGVAPQWPNA